MRVFLHSNLSAALQRQKFSLLLPCLSEIERSSVSVPFWALACLRSAEVHSKDQAGLELGCEDTWGAKNCLSSNTTFQKAKATDLASNLSFLRTALSRHHLKCKIWNRLLFITLEFGDVITGLVDQIFSMSSMHSESGTGDLQSRNDGLRVSRRNHGNERFNLVIPCFFCN